MAIAELKEIIVRNVNLCPHCGWGMRVKDSRRMKIAGVGTVRRRRECMKCAFRYSTIEVPIPERSGLGLVTLALSGQLRDKLLGLIADAHELEQEIK